MLAPGLKIYKFALSHHPATIQSVHHKLLHISMLQRWIRALILALSPHRRVPGTPMPDNPAKPRNRYCVPRIPPESPAQCLQADTERRSQLIG